MKKRTLANVLQSSDITNRPSSSSSPSSTSNNQNNKKTTKTRRVIYVSSALDVAGSSFIEPSTPPEGIISQESDPAPTTTTDTNTVTTASTSTTLSKRTGSKTAIGGKQMDHGNNRRQSNDHHASSASSSSSQSEVFSSGESLITSTTTITTMRINETSTEQQQQGEKDEEESRMRGHSPPDRKRAKRSHSNVTNSSADAVQKPVITYCGSRRATRNVVTHSTNKENDNLEATEGGEVLSDALVGSETIANSTRVREDSDREVLQIEHPSNAGQETANEYQKTEIYVQNDTNVTISVQIFPSVPVKGKVYGERYIFPGKTQFVKVRQNRKSNHFFVSVSTKNRKQMYRAISCLEFSFKHEPFRLVVRFGQAIRPFTSEDTRVTPFTIDEHRGILNSGNSSDSDESTSF